MEKVIKPALGEIGSFPFLKGYIYKVIKHNPDTTINLQIIRTPKDSGLKGEFVSSVGLDHCRFWQNLDTKLSRALYGVNDES